MGLPRWEVADKEMGRRTYHRRWDVQDGKWKVMRWMRLADEFTTWHGTSKMKSGRSWDGKTNLPQEMGRLRWEVAGDGKTNLPQEMGLPRWEVAGKEMGRPICHMTWDFQAGDGTSKMGSGRSRDGKTNFPQETWLPRWGVEGNEMGRRIYHRRCDVQDVMRWEDEFTTGDVTSKMGSGR